MATGDSETLDILLIEEDPESASLIAAPLSEIKEAEIDVVSSENQLLAFLDKRETDLILLDHCAWTNHMMPRLHREHPGLYIIVLLPHPDEELLLEYVKSGANGVIFKNHTNFVTELTTTVKRALIKIVQRKAFLTDSITNSSFFSAGEEEDEALLALKALKSGQSLRHYEVLDELGHGGMGEVYSAKDRKLGRKVAIKVLPPRITQDVSARQRLVREARAASALNHPNIITIHSIEEERDVIFIVMEYVEGTSLSQMFKSGPLDLTLLLDIGIQTADALAAAHGAGLVHRDIKPGNIMVTARGQVKLLDFGLAKWMPNFNEENPEDPTDKGVVGTISYMSPEQAKGDELDLLSDIFSLGSVLYEAAIGRSPFEGHTLLAVMQQIISKRAPLPSGILSSVPLAFDGILQRAMEKRKEDRYPSAGEFAADLRHLKAAMTHDVSDPVVQAALNRLLIQRSPDRHTPTRLHTATTEKINGKIFLVEDNEDNRDMLSRRLQRKGFLVSSAVSGEEAIERIPEEMPDLILMDISLPLRDGFDVSRELKSLDKTKSIPIIALTAHAMPEDKEKALSCGCSDYDTKPVDLDRLLKKMQSLLKKN